MKINTARGHWLLLTVNLLVFCGCGDTKTVDPQPGPADPSIQKKQDTVFEFKPKTPSTDDGNLGVSVQELQPLAFTDVAKKTGLEFTYRRLRPTVNGRVAGGRLLLARLRS